MGVPKNGRPSLTNAVDLTPRQLAQALAVTYQCGSCGTATISIVPAADITMPPVPCPNRAGDTERFHDRRIVAVTPVMVEV